MVREDIFGGLKSALTRGYTLKEAMISFYNAGYSKEEIEDAARQLQYRVTENKELRSSINQKSSGASVYIQEKQQVQPQNPVISRVEVPPSKAPQKSPSPTMEVPPKPGIPPTATVSSSPSDAVTEVQAVKKKPSGFSLMSILKGKAPDARQKLMPKQKPKVPNYHEGTSIQVVTIVLVVLLLLLLSMLAGVFIFKNQIIQFFNNLLLKG